MPPPVRRFPTPDGEHRLPPTSGQLDELLQFEPEKRSVGSRDETDVSVQRPASVARSAARVAVAVPQHRKSPGVPASAARPLQSLWHFVFGSALGSLLTSLILVPMNVASRAPQQALSLPPPEAFETTEPVEAPVDSIALAPVAFAEEKKPAARPPLARSAVIEKPVSPTAPASTTGPAARVRFYGSLAIESTPVGARAYINGEPVGSTPLVLTELPVGSRAVRLEADDHMTWSSTVRVVAGQQTTVNATLSPSR